MKIKIIFYSLLLTADVLGVVFGAISGSPMAAVGFGLMLLSAVPLFFLVTGEGAGVVHAINVLLLLRVLLGVFLACMPSLANPIRHHIIPLSICLVVDLLLCCAFYLFVDPSCYDKKKEGSKSILCLPVLLYLFPLGWGIGSLYYAISTTINVGWETETLTYYFDGVAALIAPILCGFVKNKKAVMAMVAFLCLTSISLGCVFALARDWGHYFSEALIAAIPHMLIPFLFPACTEFLAYRERIFAKK